MEVTGNQFTMDLLAIKPDAHNEIHYVQFGENNANWPNVNDFNVCDSKMDN